MVPNQTYREHQTDHAWESTTKFSNPFQTDRFLEEDKIWKVKGKFHGRRYVPKKKEKKYNGKVYDFGGGK